MMAVTILGGRLPRLSSGRRECFHSIQYSANAPWRAPCPRLSRLPRFCDILAGWKLDSFVLIRCRHDIPFAYERPLCAKSGPRHSWLFSERRRNPGLALPTHCGFLRDRHAREAGPRPACFEPSTSYAALVDALWVGLAVEPGDQQAELREDLRAFCTSRVPWRIPPGPLRSSASQRWVSQEAFMEEFVDGYEQTLGREPSEIAAGSGALTF
jgi:hypothetical protein